MSTLRTLAIATAFVGSASLALAQGAGIAPNSSNLPPQQQGASTSAPGTAQSAQMTRSKTSKMKLYNKATTKKHRKIYNEAVTPKKKTQPKKSQSM